jgi:hypothetical protein
MDVERRAFDVRANEGGGVMATLTAWKFPSADGADAAFQTLRDLARRELIDVLDAVVISWPEDSPKPETTPERYRLRPAPSPACMRSPRPSAAPTPSF